MRVLKFGGTSVGSAAAIKSLKPLLESKLEDSQLVVVVSAMSGVTNLLVQTTDLAEAGNKEYLSNLDELQAKHREAIDELIDQKVQDKI
jgi:aspartokinase/homoserine dehydrogenase 1